MIISLSSLMENLPNSANKISLDQGTICLQEFDISDEFWKAFRFWSVDMWFLGFIDAICYLTGAESINWFAFAYSGTAHNETTACIW